MYRRRCWREQLASRGGDFFAANIIVQKQTALRFLGGKEAVSLLKGFWSCTTWLRACTETDDIGFPTMSEIEEKLTKAQSPVGVSAREQS